MNHLAEGKENHDQVCQKDMKHQQDIVRRVGNLRRYNRFKGKQAAQVGAVVLDLYIKSGFRIPGCQMHVAAKDNGQEQKNEQNIIFGNGYLPNG